MSPFKSISLSFAIAVLYYLIVTAMSILLYRLLGLYLVENYPDYLGVIDAIIYLVLILILIAVFKRRMFFESMDRSQKEALKNQVFSIVILMLLFRVVIDPIVCSKYILGYSSIPTANVDIDITIFSLRIITSVFLFSFVEEFIFRYLILDKLLLANNIPILKSILVSGVAFCLVHLSMEAPLSRFPFYIGMFLLGVLLGFLYIKFGLWGAIMGHAMYNFTINLVSLVRDQYLELINQLQFGFLYWFLIGIALVLFLFGLRRMGLLEAPAVTE